MKQTQSMIVFARILVDGAMIWLGLILAYFIRMVWFEAFGLGAPATLISLEGFIEFSIKMTVFLVLMMALNRQYRFEKNHKWFREWATLFWSFSAGLALILVIFFFTKYQFFSRFIMGMAWVCGLVLLTFGRILLRVLQHQLLQRNIGRSRLLILGTSTLAHDLHDTIKDDVHFEIIGFLSGKKNAPKQFCNQKVYGGFSQFEKTVEKHTVDHVILAGESLHLKSIQKIVQLCHIKGITFEFLPDPVNVDLTSVEVSTLRGQPIITVLNTRMMGWGLVIKSITDFVLAFVALILLLPVLVLIALRIKCEDPKAPVFYAASRVGKNGKPFRCVKFRSMVANAEELKKELLKKNTRKGGVFFKMEDDPRVTKFGKFLRKSSLDELPQIWNVLKGEMSWVGPRPHLPEEVTQYTDEDRRLIGVKPGLTGFAQINGLSHLSFEEEMKLELYYLKNWSLWLDIIIFIKTIGIVIRGKNS